MSGETEGMRDLIWHYTVGHRAQDGRGCFFDILSSGYIDVSRETDGRPIAWFSADQVWERTVMRAKGIVNLDTGAVFRCRGPEDMLAFGVKPFRIGIERERLLNWTALRLQSGMSANRVTQLIRGAARRGANQWDWYGSFSPVLRADWRAVQRFTESGWGNFENDNGAPAQPWFNHGVLILGLS